MTDLSHWNFAATFTARQAAALILGYEPDQAWKPDAAVSRQVTVVHERMKHDHDRALRFNHGRTDVQTLCENGLLVCNSLARQLKSSSGRGHQLESSLWLLTIQSLSKIDEQVFDRRLVQAWIAANRMQSAYDFGDSGQKARAGGDQGEEIDPSDLPDELHAANIAFRAVTNGQGDPGATFKNRLVQYLRANFDFSDEAVQRIATVANPDKSAGRKKRAA